MCSEKLFDTKRWNSLLLKRGVDSCYNTYILPAVTFLIWVNISSFCYVIYASLLCVCVCSCVRDETWTSLAITPHTSMLTSCLLYFITHITTCITSGANTLLHNILQITITVNCIITVFFHCLCPDRSIMCSNKIRIMQWSYTQNKK